MLSFKQLKLATEAAAALASLVGTCEGRALVVVEVDMKTEAGRLMKQAADEIRNLRSQVESLGGQLSQAQSEGSGLRDENNRLQQFEPDAEDTSAEQDLSGLLGGSGSQQSPGSGSEDVGSGFAQRATPAPVARPASAPVARPSTTVTGGPRVR